MHISIIIPHLNDEAALSQCLAALSAQISPPEHEVIVVDNGSHVLPETVCARFGGVRLYQETSPGPGPARNLGATHAKAPILAFVDADCAPAPNWLAEIQRVMEAPGAPDIIAGAVHITPANPPYFSAIEAYEQVYSYRQALFVRRDGYAATANMAARKAIFDDIGGFGGLECAEDMDWGKRATAAGYRTVYKPEVRASTPARPSFAQLDRKWDRHIAHDANAWGQGVWPKLKWFGRALIIGISPLLETPTIVTTPLLTGAGNRLRCFVGMVRVRLYRMRRMATLGLGVDQVAAMAQSWRED